MLKAAIFLVAFAVLIPGGIIAARFNRVIRDICFWAMVFFSCWLIQIHIAPDPDWRGASRGFAFSAVNCLTLIVLGSMIGAQGFKVRLLPKGGIWYLLYFTLSAISVVNADLPMKWGFEISKMAFMYLYFITASAYLAGSRKLWPLIYAIIVTMGFVFAVGFYQKYFGGYFQIPSTMPHQNSLALYCSMFGCLMMGVLLNEKMTPLQWCFVAGTVAVSGVLILFTLSRGGLLCFAFGQAVTMGVSLIVNGFTARRTGMVLLILVLLSIPAVIAAPRVIHRFLNAPESSTGTRVNLAKAAVRMADAHFWGVGLNNFSDKSGPLYDYNHEHYESYREGSVDDRQGGIVETIYLLVAAECGWITLAALLVWLLSYYWYNFRNLFFYRRQPGFGIAAGIMGGLTANYLQSAMEWVLKQYNNFTQLMLIFALISVMWQFRKHSRE